MNQMFMRFFLVGSGVLSLLGWSTNSNAATLADWHLGEATNGPVVTSIDSSGHPLRSLHSPTAAEGYGGPAPNYTSFPVFPGSDGRGVDFVPGTTGLLVTSNKNVFSTSEFTNGFTWEIVYRMSNAIPNGTFRALSAIENAYAIAVLGASPSPELMFMISGTFGFSISSPITLDSQFHHVAGIYDPNKTINGVQDLFLYYDYSLVDMTNGFSLYNIDALNEFASVGGFAQPSNPQSMFEVIDRVRISDSILSVPQFIPEPSAVLLFAFAALLWSNRCRR